MIKSILVSSLIGFSLFIGAYNFMGYDERESEILDRVLKMIEGVHVKLKPIDDVFAAEVFETYLERIDSGKRFFIQEEIDQLAEQKLMIDDQTQVRTFEFFDESIILLDDAMVRAKKIYEEVIQESYSFEEDEFIELDPEKKSYAASVEALKDMWRKNIKYDIMTKVYKRKKDQEKNQRLAEDKGEPFEVVSMETMIEEAKEDTKENFDDWFERMGKLRRSDRFETYLSAITNYFDPHTDYFNPKQKEDFDINMGGKLEGIGARLTLDGDYTKISSIIPGGPAYRSKQLEVNDLIMAVAQEGEEPIDITGWRLDDVVQKIRGKKGTKVTLTTQKTDGDVVDIVIERDEVIIDESFARSVILDMPDRASNIGYIRLPKFYSSFEKEDGNSCAVDVAKELEKLKAEDVNGVILDLRGNTGGSLSDVVAMSGLFIEEGPIVQVKPRDRDPYVHEDDDSSVQYDGPLIIMTDNYSASASEILAAAMQDYGRAVIVGSNSTFGKGSVQRFFDLDRWNRGGKKYDALGNLKISMQKFYRVNGGSTQLKGVIPDIILPDAYHYIETGEKEYENALEWSEIPPQEYSQNVVDLQNLPEVVSKSQKRIDENQVFQLILENAKRLKENRDFSNYPLSLAAYEDLMESRKKEAEKYDDLFKEDIVGFNIRNMESDLEYIQSDSSRIDRNTEWIKDLKKDVYLTETLSIMRDLIRTEESYAHIEAKLEAIDADRVIKP